MDVNTELFLAISSIVGGLVSLFAAIATYRNDNRKAKLEEDSFAFQEELNLRERIDKVDEETVGLYRQLSNQYLTSSKKDKEFLRKITLVIRKLLVLERSVNDLISELDARWEVHANEANEIGCPFYSGLNEFFWERINSLENQLSGTMEDIDSILLNGGSHDGDSKQ